MDEEHRDNNTDSNCRKVQMIDACVDNMLLDESVAYGIGDDDVRRAASWFVVPLKWRISE
jgi:hypothetical protein